VYTPDSEENTLAYSDLRLSLRTVHVVLATNLALLRPALVAGERALVRVRGCGGASSAPGAGRHAKGGGCFAAEGRVAGTSDVGAGLTSEPASSLTVSRRREVLTVVSIVDFLKQSRFMYTPDLEEYIVSHRELPLSYQIVKLRFAMFSSCDLGSAWLLRPAGPFPARNLSRFHPKTLIRWQGNGSPCDMAGRAASWALKD
jgi:hypothetical protein